jgi:hypothetical protein
MLPGKELLQSGPGFIDYDVRSLSLIRKAHERYGMLLWQMERVMDTKEVSMTH